MRQHYDDNKKYYLDKAAVRTTELRNWLKGIKSELRCQECGEDHPACIEFHHRNSSQKDINLADVASKGWSKEKILQEIEKCDILCSNCHRKHHFDTKTGPWASRS